MKGNGHIESWSKTLGLLPIPLFQLQAQSERKFILLNGQSNNFCVDFDNAFTAEEYKSFAWSSGVDNFLTIDKDTLLLYRWFKSVEERIPLATVDKNITSFYDYLARSKSNKDNSIVSFTIRIFNKLRNAIHKEEGGLALQAFLYLLASADDDKPNLQEWGLTKASKSVVDQINSNDLEIILHDFKNGMPNDHLKPYIKLMLRHTAGRLFEEAHFAAFTSPQLNLFGPSDHVSFKTRTPQQYGAYFTPSYIARSIVDEILKSYNIIPDELTIFDPACGSSEFLIEILRQLKALNYQGKLKLIGWDDSDIAVQMSTFILTYELREWDKAKVSFEITKHNSLLDASKWPHVDILLMNPPFISWELMRSQEEREQVKNILKQAYNKNPNQAAAFFRLSLDSLKPGGRLGCLLPSAIFNSDSHKTLRQIASEILNPLVIARLGSFVFENALVDACMFIGERSNQAHGTKIIWTQNIADVTSKALRELRKLHFNPDKIVNEPNQYSIYPVSNAIKNNDNWMPISYEAANLKIRVEEKIRGNFLVRIDDIFDVHRGADPGRKYFKISQEFFDKLRKPEKKYFRPCVESINIHQGTLSIVNYLFFPKTEGLKAILTENDLSEEVPTFYNAFLKPHKIELSKRKVTDNEKWWNLQRHRNWQEKKFPKLVSAAFGKAGDFAIDDNGEFVVEQSCAWLPQKEHFPIDILYAYLTIFCSDYFNLLLKTYSKQLAGGEWYNLQTKHVKDIPVPDLFNQEAFDAYLKQLSALGKEVSNGRLPLLKEKIDQIVREIFE